MNITQHNPWIGTAIVATFLLSTVGCDNGAAQRAELARAQVRQIAADLDSRTTETGVYIRVKADDIKQIDPWGTQVQVSYSQGGVAEIVSVRSAGPDRQFHTSDDIAEEKMAANLKGIGEGIKKNTEEVASKAAKGFVKGTVQGIKESVKEALPFKKKKENTSVIWNLDNLESIGGHKVTVVGKPRVIETDQGNAIEFDGKEDGIFVAANPLSGLKEFTAEVIFRPAADGPKEQRFLHFQPTGTEDRLLFETRLTPDGQWFLDTYLQTGEAKCTLFAEKFLHPLGPWYHAAIVVDGKTMRHYVNGKEELVADVQSTPLAAGETSIGVRFNKVHWYQGAIRQIRITPAVLKPAEFLKP